mgnify:CR=1 FL=1
MKPGEGRHVDKLEKVPDEALKQADKAYLVSTPPRVLAACVPELPALAVNHGIYGCCFRTTERCVVHTETRLGFDFASA